jgi:hypothetical protein
MLGLMQRPFVPSVQSESRLQSFITLALPGPRSWGHAISSGRWFVATELRTTLDPPEAAPAAAPPLDPPEAAPAAAPPLDPPEAAPAAAPPLDPPEAAPAAAPPLDPSEALVPPWLPQPAMIPDKQTSDTAHAFIQATSGDSLPRNGRSCRHARRSHSRGRLSLWLGSRGLPSPAQGEIRALAEAERQEKSHAFAPGVPRRRRLRRVATWRVTIKKDQAAASSPPRARSSNSLSYRSGAGLSMLVAFDREEAFDREPRRRPGAGPSRLLPPLQPLLSDPT